MSALAHQTATAALLRLMEGEINQQCGVKGKWEQNPGRRQGYRNGWGPGLVWIGGRYVSMERPRAVRCKESGGGELILESYLQAQDPKFASDAVLTALVLGVSQRCYPAVVGAVNPVGESVEVVNMSKSALGRQFIAASTQYLKAFLSRQLTQRYLVVWLDMVAGGDYSALAAVGLTESGEKHILGLRQSTSESAAECREFLEDLVARGLSAAQGLLFVVDGGKGLGSGLREVFGKEVLVQRCRVHKKRNVLDKLPEKDREAIELRLEEAWACGSEKLAQAKLELLARGLDAQGHKSAAKSLREGGRDILTCHRLGVPAGLLETLSNTNVIESAFSLHESTSHRVKRWRNGKQFLRWVAAGLYRAERAFVKLNKPEALAALAQALARHADAARRSNRQPISLAQTG